MSNNLGNVAGLVISDNPPLEADGVTEKRYVWWAKPVGTSPNISYQLRYFKSSVDSWVNHEANLINDSLNVSSVFTYSINKIKQLLNGTITAASIIDSLTSSSVNNPLSANQGKVLNEKINTITINSNPFSLKKKPSNNNANVEIGDIIVNGWWDDNLYIISAIYVGGNVNNITSWKILDSWEI